MAFDLPLPSGSSLAAAQAKLNAIIASGQPGTLILSGNYTWGGTLTMSAATRVSIVGLNAQITQTTAETATILVTGCSQPTVTGIRFVGTGAEDPWDGSVWNGVAGIWIVDSDDVAIYGNHFANHAGGAIRYGQTCNRMTISDNFIVGMGTAAIEAADNGADFAISTESDSGTPIAYQLTIQGNHISGHAQGIGTTWGGAHAIIGNTIRGIPGQHGIYSVCSSDCTISGNTISDTSSSGIKVQFNTEENRIKPVCISGNTLYDIGTNAIEVTRATGGGTNIRRNASIVGNMIDTAQYGIFVSGQYGVAISGNSVSRTTNAAYYLASSSGSMMGNVARESDAAAVRLVTPEGDWVIDGLDCVDCAINSSDPQLENTEFRSILWMDDGAAASTLFLNGIIMRMENVAESANLQYGLNGVGSTLTINCGHVINTTSKPNVVAGTLVEAIAESVVVVP